VFLGRIGYTREQQITFGQMRESGVFGVMVFCSDYRCSHSTALPAIAGWIMCGCRISSRMQITLEPRFGVAGGLGAYNPESRRLRHAISVAVLRVTTTSACSLRACNSSSSTLA
jgi:hypothetical protein